MEQSESMTEQKGWYAADSYRLISPQMLHVEAMD
jgi:hypothetical protein